jgi:hypothetical protein
MNGDFYFIPPFPKLSKPCHGLHDLLKMDPDLGLPAWSHQFLRYSDKGIGGSGWCELHMVYILLSHILCVCVCVCVYETGSHYVAQTGLEI